MNRKDYLTLADALRNARADARIETMASDLHPSEAAARGAECAAEAVANLLASQSRAFDRALFLRNAGVIRDS
jgi:hypothetical protein